MNSGEMMTSFAIQDDLAGADTGAIEVVVSFASADDRWCFFITPNALSASGDLIPGTNVRLHFGEPHMFVVSEINEDIVRQALEMAEAEGTLLSRTLETSQERSGNALASTDFEQRSAAAHRIASMPISAILDDITSALHDGRAPVRDWAVMNSAINAVLTTGDLAVLRLLCSEYADAEDPAWGDRVNDELRGLPPDRGAIAHLIDIAETDDRAGHGARLMLSWLGLS